MSLMMQRQVCNCDSFLSLPETSKLLIIDDDLLLRERLSRSMEERGYDVYLTKNIKETKELVAHISFDYTIIDLKLSDGFGLELLGYLKTKMPLLRPLILTAHGNIATAISAIKMGALDYLTKPADPQTIDLALKNTMPTILPLPADDIISPDRLKWEHIQRVLVSCNQNVSETARRLKMHRRSLQRILNKNAPRF